MYRSLHRELLLPKQFLGKVYNGWFAILNAKHQARNKQVSIIILKKTFLVWLEQGLNHQLASFTQSECTNHHATVLYIHMSWLYTHISYIDHFVPLMKPWTHRQHSPGLELMEILKIHEPIIPHFSFWMVVHVLWRSFIAEVQLWCLWCSINMMQDIAFKHFMCLNNEL